MSDRFVEYIIGAIVCAIVGAWSAFVITHVSLDRKWKKQAIEHECAQYHPKTGEFMWREDK